MDINDFLSFLSLKQKMAESISKCKFTKSFCKLLHQE